MTTPRRLVSLLGVGLALLVFAGCSPAKTAVPDDNTSAKPGAAGEVQVRIATFRYQPETLEVKVGTKVTWKNEDAILHTATSGTSTKKDDFGNFEIKKNGTFEGTMDDVGKSFSYTFATVGEYNYFCSRHNNMQGKVVVK